MIKCVLPYIVPLGGVGYNFPQVRQRFSRGSPRAWVWLAGLCLGGLFTPLAQAASYGNLYGSATATTPINIVLDTATKAISMRFTAKSSKTIAKIRIYVAGKVGTSPTYTIGIKANSAGAPTGAYPSSITSALATGWNTIDIPDLAITSGTIYHLIIEYSSGTINGSNYVRMGITQPNLQIYPNDGSADANARALYDEAGDGFANDTADDTNPTYILEYTDSTYEGNGIFQLQGLATSQVYGSPTSQWVGETFTVSGGDRYAISVAFFLRAPTGVTGDDCIVHFEDTSAPGIDIETGTIATAAGITSSFALKTFTFSKVRKLQNGRQYRVYLTASASVDDSNSYEVLIGSSSGAVSDLTYDGNNAVMQTSTNRGGSWTSQSQRDCYFNFTLNPLNSFKFYVATTTQTNNTTFTGAVRITAIDSDGTSVLTTFDASKQNVTISAPGGIISGLSGGGTLTAANDFSSGVATITNLLKFSGTAAMNLVFTATSELDGKTGTASVTITHAALDHFAVVLNAPQVNNTSFTGINTITSQDISSNTVVNFDASANNVTVTSGNAPAPYTISGLGSAKNNVLNQNTDFSSGVANLTALLMTYKGSTGSYTFTATFSVGGKTGTSGSILINPGSLTFLTLAMAGAQTNGVAFSGVNSLTLYDVSGNVITNFNPAVTNLTLTTNSPTGNSAMSGLGSGSNNVLNQAGDTTNGVANLTTLGLKYTGVTGTYNFDARAQGVTSNVKSVLINPGALDHFSLDVSSPQTNGAAWGTTARVTALDASNNVKTNFNPSGNVVTPTVGTTGIFSGLSGGNKMNLAADFVSGIANLVNLGMVYTGPDGPITLTMTSADGKTGTANLSITHAALDHFNVGLTTSQVVGVAFTSTNKITAKDISNNTVVNFNASTDNVTISTSSTSGNVAVSGLAGAGNRVLNQANDFAGGIADLASRLKYAGVAPGPWTFTGTSAGGKSGTSAGIAFTTGALEHIHLIVNTPQKNGATFTSAFVTLHDEGHNLIAAAPPSVTLTVVENPAGYTLMVGPGRLNILDQPADFSNSVSDLSLKLTYAGPVGTYTFQAAGGGKTTTQANVVIAPGDPTHFHWGVTTPQTDGAVWTGSARLTSHDVSHNVVDTFNANTYPVTIGVNAPAPIGGGNPLSGLSGGTKLTLSTDFSSGVANLISGVNQFKYTGYTGQYDFTATVTSLTNVTGKATVTINLGPLDHFDLVTTGFTGPWTSPQKNGQIFTGPPVIVAHDVGNNYITDYDASQQPVTLTCNSPTGNTAITVAAGRSNVLNQFTDFVNGYSTLGQLKYAGQVGTFTFGLVNSVGKSAYTPVTLQILPGDIHHFHLQFASPQGDGVVFGGLNAITAHDAQDNVKTDFNPSIEPVSVLFNSGSYSLIGLGQNRNFLLNQTTDFVNGIASLGFGTANTLKYVGTIGNYTVTAACFGTITGSFSPVQITLGAFDHLGFTLSSPQAHQEAFVSGNGIMAFDIGHNVMTNFNTSGVNITFTQDKAGAGLTLTGSFAGNGTILPAASFTNGSATLTNNLIYTGPGGALRVTATASNGLSSMVTITIDPGEFDHFLLSLSSPQKSTVPFTLTNIIVAVDNNNKTARSFTGSGLTTTLTTDRTGGTLKLTGLYAGADALQTVNFSNGVITMTNNLVYGGPVGIVWITAFASNGKFGSTKITIESGDLDHFTFTLSAPQIEGAVWSGTALVIAFDGANNTLINFNPANNPVTLTFGNATYAGAGGTLSGFTGGNQLTLASDFAAGVATLASKMIYTGTPGVLQLTATSADGKFGTVTLTMYKTPLVSDFSVRKGFVHTLTTLNLTGVGFFGVTLVALDDADGTKITGFTVSSHTVITSVTLTAGLSSGAYHVKAFNYAGAAPTSMLKFSLVIGMDDPESRVVKSANNIQVLIPPAAFTADSIIIATPETSSPTVISAANRKSNVLTRLTLLSALEYTVREITAVGGSLKSGVSATLVFPYTGVTDQFFEDNLKVIVLNTTTQSWEVADGTQILDKANKKISLATTHFSIYRVAAQVKTYPTFAELAVFPNPVNFSKAVRNSLKFDKLTQDLTIKIYTVSGELVRKMSPGASGNDGTSGKAEWDGKNDQGEPVAQGLYFYLLLDAAGNKVSGKIVVTK